jgi:dsDNA-specific endonuclease/ATPase MutS2
MGSKVGVGDAVQTALGKGIVRDVRRRGRILVEVKGRAMELDADAVSPLATAGRTTAPPATFGHLTATARRPPGALQARDELDLHGLTVEEALARVDAAINAALLADAAELRVIHGRSGGRLRGALHRRLRDIATVRGFHLDPRNPGVTVVIF